MSAIREIGGTHFLYINGQQNPEVSETIRMDPINPLGLPSVQCVSPRFSLSQFQALQAVIVFYLDIVLCLAFSCFIVPELYVLTHGQLCSSASTQTLPEFT